MSHNGAVQGLSCPKCGGIVPIAEGQTIAHCPYCDLRSWVRGQSGLPRAQVARTVDRARAVRAFQQFLSGHAAIARDAGRQAQLSEAFLAHIPLWLGEVGALGFAFGQKKVGKDSYEAREYKAVERLSWNGAACDLSEFGLSAVPMGLPPLQPYDERALSAEGMVFEPVNSRADAEKAAGEAFEQQLNALTGKKLDRVTQEFKRFVHPEFRLVYYPVWMLRYLYHGRAFQVAVDGASGKVLYGKAPGSVMYRAAVLVGGMALGAFVAVDVAAFFAGGDDDSACLVFVAIAIGLSIMLAAYRAFRHGEQYELRAT
jgi:hypothetical protein